MADIEKQLPFVGDRIFDNFSYALQFINEVAFHDYNISCDTGMKILAALQSPKAVLKQWEEHRIEALEEAEEMHLMMYQIHLHQKLVKRKRKRKRQRKNIKIKKKNHEKLKIKIKIKTKIQKEKKKKIQITQQANQECCL